jgi:hypothetical protein
LISFAAWKERIMATKTNFPARPLRPRPDDADLPYVVTENNAGRLRALVRAVSEFTDEVEVVVSDLEDMVQEILPDRIQ